KPGAEGPSVIVPVSPAAIRDRRASATPVESPGSAAFENASRSVSSRLIWSATVILLPDVGSERLSGPIKLSLDGSLRHAEPFRDGLDGLVEEVVQHANVTLFWWELLNRRRDIGIESAEHNICGPVLCALCPVSFPGQGAGFCLASTL